MIPVARSIAEARRIAQLTPDTRRAYEELLRRLAARGIRVYTGQTRRTPAQQAALVAGGQSATASSWHTVGRAIDAYPIDPDTGRPDHAGRRVDLFRAMHLEAARMGFRGLAFRPDGSKRYITTRTGRVWDAGHLEYPGPFATVAQAAAAERRLA